MWDLLFGTYLAPARRPPPVALGLADGARQPIGLRAELVWPFCLRRSPSCATLGRVRWRSGG